MYVRHGGRDMILRPVLLLLLLLRAHAALVDESMVDNTKITNHYSGRHPFKRGSDFFFPLLRGKRFSTEAVHPTRIA